MSPADGNSKYLQTIGVARREDTRLVFRNPIYRDFAASSPQLTTFIPELPPGSVAVAIRLIPTPADAFDSLRSAELREFAETSVHAATLAYNAGAYRPALIGFGAALEALLIDVLTSRASPAEIAQAIAAAKPSWNQFEDRANPMSWRLVNLIRIARELPTNGVLVIDPPDALREWRNLVHPAAAINPYRASADLEPEARAASGLLAGLLRDLH